MVKKWRLCKAGINVIFPSSYPEGTKVGYSAFSLSALSYDGLSIAIDTRQGTKLFHRKDIYSEWKPLGHPNTINDVQKSDHWYVNDHANSLISIGQTSMIAVSNRTQTAIYRNSAITSSTQWKQCGKAIKVCNSSYFSDNPQQNASVSLSSDGKRIAVSAFCKSPLWKGKDGISDVIQTYAFRNNEWTKMDNLMQGSNVQMNGNGNIIAFDIHNVADNSSCTDIYKYNGTNWIPRQIHFACDAAKFALSKSGNQIVKWYVAPMNPKTFRWNESKQSYEKYAEVPAGRGKYEIINMQFAADGTRIISTGEYADDVFTTVVYEYENEKWIKQISVNTAATAQISGDGNTFAIYDGDAKAINFYDYITYDDGGNSTDDWLRTTASILVIGMFSLIILIVLGYLLYGYCMQRRRNGNVRVAEAPLIHGLVPAAAIDDSTDALMPLDVYSEDVDDPLMRRVKTGMEESSRESRESVGTSGMN